MATLERAIIESMFMIADKDGNDVPFILNSAQAEIDNNLTGRDVIPKARQEGVSSYYLARALAKCLSKRNTRAVIISHEEKATQRMLQKVQYMIKHMRGPKPVIKSMSANAITFPKMDSMLYIGTAGAKKFGRGDTINFLHCSEVAYWPDPKTLTAGLFQAVPKSGEIGIESTGNGQGNWYHKLCMRAQSGLSQYHLHFLPWHTFEEYQKPLTPEQEEQLRNNLNPDWNELELIEKHGLTLNQIAWRRDTLEELDYDLKLFAQEYPMTLAECFQATGYSLFTNVDYEETNNWERVERTLHILKGHPDYRLSYAIGADVGAGVGQDSSVAQIICLNTMEQVGEYADNSIPPDEFGLKLAELGKKFNNAYIIPENNNHGIVTISELLKVYPNHLIYKRPRKGSGLREDVDKITDYGFRTSVKSKPYAIGELRKLTNKYKRDDDRLTIHSPALKDEMDSFVEDENGKMGAEVGSHDDRVMAMAMVVVGLERALIASSTNVTFMPTMENDPFSLDSIIKELHGREQNFPIKPQFATEQDTHDGEREVINADFIFI